MSTRPTFQGIIVQLDSTHWQAYHNPAGTLTPIGSPGTTSKVAESSANAAYYVAKAGKAWLAWEVMGREDLH